MKNAIVNFINNSSGATTMRKTFGFNSFEARPERLNLKTKRVALIVNAVLCAVLCLWATSEQAKAASFSVNATTDAVDANVGDGVCDVSLAAPGAQCTLRAAIQEANALGGFDSITVSNAVSTINLTIADLFITSSLSITGNGARNTVVQRAAGAPNFRIFYIQASNATVSISGITVANGNLGSNDGAGAGFLNNSGSTTLNLDGVTIRNNNAVASGGGIINVGILNVTNSTINNNSSLQGGGINNNSGTANISNSTISDNTATNNGVVGSLGLGGGIINFAAMTLNNVTVTNNAATNESGGFYDSSVQNCNFRNTIVAGNTAPFDPDFGGVVTSQGNNLIGKSNGANGFSNGVNGDKVGTNAAPVNAQLGDLQNNGGQTDTRALLSGSPAVDAGNNCVVAAACAIANPVIALTNDQRGAGFSRLFGAAVDVGAVELQFVPTAASVTIEGRVLASRDENGQSRGIKNARVSITFPNGEIRTTISSAFGHYQFTDIPAGEIYVISVAAKRYHFLENTVIRNIVEDTKDIDFIADTFARPKTGVGKTSFFE